MVFSAEDRILVENLQKFKCLLGAKSQFVHEFPDKGYRTPILEVADLKRRPIAAWSCLQQHIIDEAVSYTHLTLPTKRIV